MQLIDKEKERVRGKYRRRKNNLLTRMQQILIKMNKNTNNINKNNTQRIKGLKYNNKRQSSQHTEQTQMEILQIDRGRREKKARLREKEEERKQGTQRKNERKKEGNIRLNNQPEKRDRRLEQEVYGEFNSLLSSSSSSFLSLHQYTIMN